MRFLLIICLAGLALATVAGLAAPVYAPADLANHFRPWILAACVSLLALVFVGRWRRLTGPATWLAVTNAVLLALPVATNTNLVSVGGGSHVNLVSINVQVRNQHIEKVADFVLGQDADVVLLQEFYAERPAFAKALERMRATYPHVHTCDCQGLILLSKRPWIGAGGQPSDSATPPLIWARFARESGQSYRVVGLHPAYPKATWRHARHYEWLTKEFSREREPIILAGDFNATPWSWVLNRFAWASGLQRGASFALSWPAHWPFQFVLIDNVFVSKPFEVISFKVGPNVGSDHRPILARIAMP